MKYNLVSIDLAKNIFQICGFNDNREVLFNKKVKRSNLILELTKMDNTNIVMEACYSSNPWGRRIEKLGHKVFLIPPFAVKPFVIGNKNDHNDTIAIGEAFFRPRIRFVKVKTVEQQDIQSLTKIKDLLTKQKTALANQLRGLLSEYGLVMPLTVAALHKAIPDFLEDAMNELSHISRAFIQRQFNNLKHTTKQIEEVKQELLDLVKDKDDYQRLLTIPGVGPIIAATLMGTVSDPASFKNGRQFAAWLGLTPSQYSSGEINRMGSITKRGNSALRRLLIHGARSVLNWCDKKDDDLSCWLKNIKKRLPGNKAAVALANKLARIVWSILAKKEIFNVKLACASS
jgi:transposase